MTATHLRIMPPPASSPPPPAPLTPPPNRGRALEPAEVAERFYSRKVTPRWIREHLPTSLRVPGTSKPPLYFEGLVEAWIDGQLAARQRVG